MGIIGWFFLALVCFWFALMLRKPKPGHAARLRQADEIENDGLETVGSRVPIASIGIKFTVRHGSEPSAPVEIDQEPTGTGKLYVYVHRNPGGEIFYVGKGTGRRAWSTVRHSVWHKYVNERCAGKYTVQIVSYHGTNDEAEEAEDRLTSRYGEQLVNWINPGRQFDYPALARFHAARNANRLFVAETKPLESANLEQAIERYKQAMLAMYEYESITLERGLIAELSGDTYQCGGGGINILDRLTLCLYRLGRVRELNEAVDDFLTRFPQATELAMMQPVLKRRVRAMRTVADL